MKSCFHIIKSMLWVECNLFDLYRHWSLIKSFHQRKFHIWSDYKCGIFIHLCISLDTFLILLDWRRPVGHPRTIWLRTINDDPQSLNFGVNMAWRKARDRDVWHQVVKYGKPPPRSLPIKRKRYSPSDVKMTQSRLTDWSQLKLIRNRFQM